jgi:Ca2+-binding EF-hand superfamily protein
MAFNAAKSSVPAENGTKDDYIERSELLAFLVALKKYFACYYMFKKLDEDNNERLEIYDFISGLMKLRMWGWHVEDVKEARKIFNSYDDNHGGLLLMDEWCKFVED